MSLKLATVLQQLTYSKCGGLYSSYIHGQMIKIELNIEKHRLVATACIVHPFLRAGLLQSFSMANGLAIDAKEFNAATRCGLIMNIQTFPIKATN